MERNDWSPTIHRLETAMRMELKMNKKTTLLVVDDDPQICRLMERCLAEHFESVVTATDPSKAHDILERTPITHVLSDLFFGASADGLALLTLWKREFPHIERAVIFTAAHVGPGKEFDFQAANAGQSGETDADPFSEIDAVVAKTDGIDAIVAALIGSNK